MSAYYQIVCDELKERIDPGEINDRGVKEFAIAHPEHPFGQIVVFAMLRRWKGKTVRIVDDRGNDPAYYDYSDVTESVLREYNDRYGSGHKFTSMD